MRLDLIGVERAAIGDAYEKNLITDESRRRLEREFDLEEASVLHARGAVASRVKREAAIPGKRHLF